MTAIEFENISKQYRLGLVSSHTLSHDLNRWWQTSVLGKEDPYLKIGETNDRTSKGKSEYVWALKDINFKVEQGDVVGIIGKNGAGKSTLLKLLSRVTGPTTGTIRARGRIASLLEVGTGFHQEMTGRENIYLNGAIMGMTKQEVTRKLDEIVDFSGCERYLDTPVKRYSSGMTVRLGFAVAAHLDPEILVVDEVLAVGDAEFQKKAIGKMQDVSKGEGRTVLFVSHNMASIRRLCNQGVLLEHGMMKQIGPVNEIVDAYMNIGSSNRDDLDRIIDHVVINNRTMSLTSVEINGSGSCVVNINNNTNTNIELVVRGNIKNALKIAVEARLCDKNHQCLAIYSPSHYEGETKVYPAGDFEIKTTIHLPNTILRGHYYLNLSLTNPKVEGYADIFNSILLDVEGYSMKNGMLFEYEKNGGFIFLH